MCFIYFIMLRHISSCSPPYFFITSYLALSLATEPGGAGSGSSLSRFVTSSGLYRLGAVLGDVTGRKSDLPVRLVPILVPVHLDSIIFFIFFNLRRNSRWNQSLGNGFRAPPTALSPPLHPNTPLIFFNTPNFQKLYFSLFCINTPHLSFFSLTKKLSSQLSNLNQVSTL